MRNYFEGFCAKSRINVWIKKKYLESRVERYQKESSITAAVRISRELPFYRDKNPGENKKNFAKKKPHFNPFGLIRRLWFRMLVLWLKICAHLIIFEAWISEKLSKKNRNFLNSLTRHVNGWIFHKNNLFHAANVFSK